MGVVYAWMCQKVGLIMCNTFSAIQFIGFNTTRNNMHMKNLEKVSVEQFQVQTNL